jgi:hypothetical protein
MVVPPLTEARHWLTWLTEHLPVQFLMLCLLIIGLAWFVHSENRHREAVYAPLLAACLRVMERAP